MEVYDKLHQKNLNKHENTKTQSLILRPLRLSFLMVFKKNRQSLIFSPFSL